MSPEETDEATATVLRELEEMAHQTGIIALDRVQSRMLLTWIRSLLRMINEQNAVIQRLEKLVVLEKSR